MPASILLYGAYGYTGELIARHARERGIELILAGRDGAKLHSLAHATGHEARVASLDEPSSLDAALAGARVVLHSAGPFSHTSEPMVAACLRSGAHYLDVTGEVAVFEALAARSEEAARSGVMLLPGVGFDVVPSDCLALHVKERLPDANHLTLAFRGLAQVSRGTLRTMIEGLGHGGLIRRHGELQSIGVGGRTREIDFGRGPRLCMAIPWGDLATAYRSTGIENIEVYVPVRRPALLGARALGKLAPLLSAGPVQAGLGRLVRLAPQGPSEAARQSGTSVLYAEARNPRGELVRARLRTPDGYTLTAHAALEIAQRVAEGRFEPGYQTPAGLLGADFALELAGVTREDL